MTPPDEEVAYQTEEAFPGLSFSAPVDLTTAGDGSPRLFVVEQAGTIKVFDPMAGTPSASTFLDIRSKVTDGGERGLLGLAFHPNFSSNGYFYVNYTGRSPLVSIIARYTANLATPNQADPASELVLLTFSQPYSNHNGGGMKFGKDGYLYISTGDGGSGGDPQNNAQNRANLLGKILRLDVNGTDKGNYGIPTDNPFRGNQDGHREEIYAYGLRNPWRISFDPETDQLWTGDVGQNSREEIDIITKGGNYGWRLKEGKDCYNPASNCDQNGLVGPVYDYSQADGDKSITGGFVYRGTALPALVGKYIYGDYVSGRVWALEVNNGQAGTNRLLVSNAGRISAFGVDAQQELYFCEYGGGKIMRLKTQQVP
nr:PQQ-dependent sugar dehydrogenase [Rhabdobacter roseus]